MSETQLISPLLDGFALGSALSEHDGVRCCPAIRENSDKKYIVKIIAIPASQVQMDALLLAGAYKDPEDAMTYFRQTGEDVMAEAQFLKDLSRLEGFLPYEDWQMEPITRKRLGYEVYLISSYKRSLEKHVRRNPVTHLEAVNLGLDICAALSVCRQAGALYVDLKPSNIFVSEKKEYRIGDLGFIRMDAMKYTALPQKYCSRYTPPELYDPMASLNLTVDTYALGMILYQLYNEGTLPDLNTSSDDPIPNPVNADYELAEIIMKAIHPDPQERWQDPGDMGQALVAYMQRNVVNDVPITPYTPLDVEAQNVQIPREEPLPEESEKPIQEADLQGEQVPEQSAEEVLEPAEPVDEAIPVPEEKAVDTVVTDTTDVEESPETQPVVEEQLPPTEPEPEEPLQEPETVAEPEPQLEQDNTQDTDDPADALLSNELTRIMEKANDLISHDTPVGVVLPEIPDQPDPFAFAWEDSIEVEDLNTPFDPVMEVKEDTSRTEKRQAKKFRSQERKRKIKRFFGRLFILLLFAAILLAGFWCYQNIYLQSIDSITVDSTRDQLTVNIHTDADETLLSVTCSDNYGNSQTQGVTDGKATFTKLIPNTMYKIEVSIDGFHDLVGQTSEMFTTDTSTTILTFTPVTGSDDGSVILNFTVDGEEPDTWAVVYGTEGEKQQRQTFTGHSVTIDGLTVGKVYTFTLEAGKDLSLSGNTTLEFMSARLILAENLTATTTNGTDMTIRWTSPGDTVVESWNVRCYNDSGYEETITVTDTEVYLTGIDSSVSYNVEVTAAGMTQPARTSITANPLNITALNVDHSAPDKLAVSWEFAGTTPEEGWLLMYNIDGNSDLNVIKCDEASATISPKIPEATYQFTIQSVDGTSIFGNVHSYTCPGGEPFNENGLSAEKIALNTIKTPEEKDWRFDNIGSKAFTDQFALGDGISLVLHGQTDFYLPGYELKILYVLRDAHGNVLPDYVMEKTTFWKDIWFGGDYHYGELDIPSVPEKAGSYTLDLFFNGCAVGKTSFTISE